MLLFKTLAYISFLVTINVFLVSNVNAHERFVVPSHTLLSGDDKTQLVTLIASISNAIFHPDSPFGDSNTGANVGNLKNLFSQLKNSVITPDGTVNFELAGETHPNDLLLVSRLIFNCFSMVSC